MEKILNLFKNWTKDNLFDLFWSGVVCAIITIPFILCELVTVTWSMVLYPIAGLIVALMISIFKQLVFTESFDIKGIIASLCGSLLIELSTIFGIVMYMLGR